MQKRGKKKRIGKILLIMFGWSVCLAHMEVRAAENPKEMLFDREPAEKVGQTPDDVRTEESKAPATGKWKSRNQKIFYYENGKKTVGLKQIDGKYYYFDLNGIQRTGWQTYEGHYYYFKIANGKKGYMETAKTINGIKIEEDGKAELTAASAGKLNVLLKANQVVEKATKPEMKKSEKLKHSFAYLLKHFQYRGSPDFEKSAHWEQIYAKALFEEGHGNCYAFGAAFAFLANAAGYKECYAVSSGGHGWAEINGKVYDPTWSLTDKDHNYYGISFDLSGKDGRPNYKNARKYIVKI